MMSEKIIDGGQMVSVLFLGRVFSILLYSPVGGTHQNGTAIMLGSLLGFGLQVLVVLLCQELYNRCQCSNILGAALEQGRVQGIATAGLFWLALGYYAVYSIANFEYFLTSAAYPRQSTPMIILAFTLCAGYAAYAGLEAFGRMAVILAVGFALVLGLIFLTLLPDIDWVNLRSPFDEGVKGITGAAGFSLASGSEILALFLVAPLTGKHFTRSGVMYLLCSFLCISLLTFFCTATLGYSALTQRFPVYTMFTVAQFSIFDRMDGVYVCLWVLVAIIKTALYLYTAAACLTVVVPRLTQKRAVVLCSVLFAVAAIVLSSNLPLLDASRSFYLSGAPLVVCCLVVPLWLLVSGKGREGAA